jgi:hypothetical protein
LSRTSKSATVLEEKNLNFKSSEKELSKESSHLANNFLKLLPKNYKRIYITNFISLQQIKFQ